MGVREGYVIDHINGDKLDNRKANLRFITQAGNVAAGKRRNKSGHPGVVWVKKGKYWQAQFKSQGKNYVIGRFKDKSRAAHAAKEVREQFIESQAYENRLQNVSVDTIVNQVRSKYGKHS